MLEWKAPVSDGGSPVQGYLIEKKEKNGTKWTKAIETRGPLTSATVPDLINGQEYEFRVKALNKVGCQANSSADCFANTLMFTLRRAKVNLHFQAILFGCVLSTTFRRSILAT